MKGFKFEPVRWATGALALITAILGANELVDQLGYADIIPSRAVPYLLLAEAVLALLLGKAVRDRVTPLARPRLDEDTPLVPKTLAEPGTPRTRHDWPDRPSVAPATPPPSAGVPRPRNTGMHDW